jgi:DNA-binding IscR family transcriptional regulator
LARPASEVTVGDVIRILDGPLAPMLCAGDEEYAPCPAYLCPSEEHCVLREVWLDVRDAVSSVLDETTFADLAQRQQEQPLEDVPVIDIYAQPPEARRRQWARRAPRAEPRG